MKRNKKTFIISVLAVFLVLSTMILFIGQKRESLHGKEKDKKISQYAAPSGTARLLEFYLRRNNDSGTTIDGVKFCLEAKTGEDTWEKVTGSNGKVEEFTTKNGGQIRLLELQLRELESKYGNGPYRFYQLTNVPGNYQPSIGKTSPKFTISEIESSKTLSKKITMYNRYVGTYRLKVVNGATNQPLSGVKVVLQYRYNTYYWSDIGTHGNGEIEGLPKEFVTNGLGEVTLTADQISKIMGYAGQGYFRLCVVDVPSGYLFPEISGNFSTSAYPVFYILSTGTNAVSAYGPASVKIYPYRELIFQKTDRMTTQPIPGVEFELQVQTTADGTFETINNPEIPLPDLKTGQNGEIKLTEDVLGALQQVYGTASTVKYRFKETKAAAGYPTPTENSVSGMFSLSATEVTPKKVSLSNEKLSEKLILQKQDAITNKKLQGASFVIQKQNGENWSNTAFNKTTNEDGQIVLNKSNLAQLGNGVYRFKETEAPSGYEAPTEDSVSESFEIMDNSFVSTSYLTVRNEPKEKGDIYLRFIQASSSFLNVLDSHGGKGYVTESEAANGWIRSNDTFKMAYTLAAEDLKDKDYHNVKIRVTAEVLDGKGYSGFSDSSRTPLKNVTFTINTPVNELETGNTYNPETRTVSAYQQFVLDEAQGDFIDIAIEAKIGSSFFGTELPLRYTMQIISAVDPSTGQEVQFDQGEQADLYFYDLSLPIPNNTLKVTSQLNMIPVVMGSSSAVNSGIVKNTFDKLVNEEIDPAAKVVSLGYGWKTVALPERANNSNLGLAVPKGNNQFNITLNQGILATLSNQEEIQLTLGENGDLPMIQLFSYGLPGDIFGDPVGIYNGKYSNYDRTLISRTYSNFKQKEESGTVNYEMSQNQSNGDITATVKAPTYFAGDNGYVATYSLFGIGSYLVYPAEAAKILVSRAEGSSVIQQDYTIGVKGASYEDNDGSTIEVEPETPIKGTWTEKFEEEKPEEKQDDPYLIMEKKDKVDGFLLTGGKFILEYYQNSKWNPVDISGLESFTADANGQIILDKERLEALRTKYGNVQFRFREVEAPSGYREPQDYETPSELLSAQFTIGAGPLYTPSTKSLAINNRPKNPILVVKKWGKNQAGTTISLEGAVFDLYFGKPTVENPTKDTDYEWIKVDIEKVFGLTGEEVLRKFTSNDKGEISLSKEDIAILAKNKDYGPGRYRFKEVMPPPGYILPEGDKAFTNAFTLKQDDVFPNEITMENEREAEWVDNTTNLIGSSYGYSVDKEGIPMFSKVGTSYTSAETLTTLLNRATPYSTTATNLGKVLRGEEIVVGSYQNATYYSYATDNPAYVENWKAKEAEMLQLWNPDEGELIEAGYNFFEDMDQIGKTEPIQYGVKKDGSYTVASLNSAKKDDYDWYASMEEVPKGQKVSAVYGKITNFKVNYRGIHDKKIDTRWNLYTRRIANGKAGNSPEGILNSTLATKSYYSTYTRAKISYENYKAEKEEDKEVVLDWADTAYSPTRYSSSLTTYYAPSPASSFGDTLLILPYYKPTITKKALDPATKDPQPNSKYALNSMMEFSIIVTFPKPREGTRTMPFTFTVKDAVNYSAQLEDHFVYRKNSSSMNTNPIGDPLYEGATGASTRYLNWENISASYDETNVYTLNFQAFPKKVQKFINQAQTASFYGTISYNIDVEITEAMNSGGIYKNTSTPVIDKASNSNEALIDYTITVKNYVPDKTLRGVKIFDILPFNGDERGSDFHGGFSLEKMSAERIDGTPLSDEEMKYYYTTQTLPENLKVDEAFDYPGAEWKEFKEITPEEKKQVRAIYVTMPDLPSGMAYDLSLQLSPFDNEEDDRYLNRARFGFNVTDAYGQELVAEVRSRLVETVVINRVIEGNVWQDLHYSGIMEPDEPKIPGVDVNLYQIVGGVMTKVDETTTDEEGHYRFDGVPSGYFKVGFKLPEQYSKFVITKTNVAGADPLLTNKVSQQDITEDGYHLTLDSIQLPFYEFEKDEDGNDTEKLKSLIEVKGINMGILAAPNLSVLKEVQKADENGEYSDINHGKVQVGDTIRYVITVSNEAQDSYIEDIRIRDTLPAGLKYVEGSLKLAKKAPEEDVTLDPSQYSFAENENGRWALQTEPLGNLQNDTDEIQIYFDVEVTSGARGKLTNVATATGTLPPELNYREESEVDNHITPDPTMTKEASWEGKDDKKPLKKGQEFTYTLTVKNEEGASDWTGVILSDTLNSLMRDPENPEDQEDYLVYVPNSTTVDGVSVKDADSWKEPNKLTLNLGDFEGAAEGKEKVVQFKVRLDKIPPKDSDGKIWIRNEATAVGKGINAEDEEQDYPTTATDEFTLENYQSTIKLHVRQVVVKPEDSLVVPKEGYLMLQQLKGDNQPVVNGMTSIQMISEKEGAQITADSFTTVLVSLLGDVETLDLNLPIIPEYYEYLGSVVSTDGTTLASDHVSSKLEKDVRPKLSAADHEEYWVTLFIQPKLNEDDQHLPRPYSWDTVSNQFGKLKSEE